MSRLRRIRCLKVSLGGGTFIQNAHTQNCAFWLSVIPAYLVGDHHQLRASPFHAVFPALVVRLVDTAAVVVKPPKKAYSLFQPRQQLIAALVCYFFAHISPVSVISPG